ncbi:MULTISPECIES: hypothetical protein [unclassified Leucobacter]|uniref:hypothetical protein n=1 Tax=unclassified Leucobacter TaxID=2621730 RepID=UPI003016D460
MNRDPFEELFGASSKNDAHESAPAPVPARERLAYEQAERVRTSQLPASKRTSPADPGDGSGDRAARAKPWIVVGIVAVLALIASIMILNLARGTQETPQPTTDATPTQTPKTTSPAKPKTTNDDDDTPTSQPSGPPTVDVGPTYDMAIGPWNATSQISQRFGPVNFNIPDGVNLVLTSDLLSSFPDSCAAMREGWGATKTDAGYVVRKPATRCAAAPELYDEVWGLTDAWVRTIR